MTQTSTRLFLVALTSILGVIFGAHSAFASVIALQSQQASTTSMIDTDAGFAELDTYLGRLADTATQLSKVEYKKSGDTNSSFEIFQCSIQYFTWADVFNNCTEIVSAPTLTSTTTGGFFDYTFPTVSLVFGDHYYIMFERASTLQSIYGADSSSTALANWSPLYSLCRTGGSALNTDCGGFIPYVLLSSDASDTSPFHVVPISAAGVPAKCGITDISACVLNAIAAAFVPGVDMGKNFSDLMDATKDHAPFGYFTSAVGALNFSTTSTSSLVTIPTPIMTYIFTPLRVALVIIVFVAGLLWLYKRLTQIQV